MIDVKLEDLVQFPEARNAFPGPRISLATLHRWRLSGVRGAKLETILVGGRRFTSAEAISRFIVEQNRDEAPTPVLSAKQRRVQAEAANRVLQEAGI